MELKGRTNPAVYTKLREHVLTMPLPAEKEHTILMLVMDWHLASGLASVVAAFDGSASIYLSNGGGFIGGAQKSTAVRAAAVHAIQSAQQALAHFVPVPGADLPERGNVYFYARTESGLLRAVASEKHLSDATDPLTALGGAMQNIVTQYRLIQASQAQTPQSN
jgi:hypothetical protein